MSRRTYLGALIDKLCIIFEGEPRVLGVTVHRVLAHPRLSVSQMRAGLLRLVAGFETVSGGGS